MIKGYKLKEGDALKFGRNTYRIKVISIKHKEEETKQQADCVEGMNGDEGLVVNSNFGEEDDD